MSLLLVLIKVDNHCTKLEREREKDWEIFLNFISFLSFLSEFKLVRTFNWKDTAFSLLPSSFLFWNSLNDIYQAKWSQHQPLVRFL
jgi:hypothetical protein